MVVTFPTSQVWAQPSAMPDPSGLAQASTETPLPETTLAETPTPDPLSTEAATATPVPSATPVAPSTATNTSQPSAPLVLAGPQANSGTILSLTGTSGNPIVISASVRADSSIQNSNLLYVLYSPTGSVLTTRKISAPRGMDAGDIFNDSFSYSNPPATGSYRITLCWSTGNAENCDITSAETQFYSVPTLGWGLSIVAVLMLAAFLYQHRREFSKVRG